MAGSIERREEILQVANPIADECREHYFNCISGISRNGTLKTVFLKTGKGQVSLGDLLSMAQTCGQVKGIIQGLGMGNNDGLNYEIAETLLDVMREKRDRDRFAEKSPEEKQTEEKLRRWADLGI